MEEANPNAKFLKDGYLKIVDKKNNCEHHIAMTRALGHKVIQQHYHQLMRSIGYFRAWVKPNTRCQICHFEKNGFIFSSCDGWCI